MATKRIIPKEELTAYQRWELASLDDPAPVAEGIGGKSGQADAVRLPTAEEIERIHQQAHEEAYAAGLREGRAEAQREVRQLRALLAEMERALAEFENAMARPIVDLALEIARQLTRRALAAEPERILDVVREAIEALPQVGQNPVLVLNPDDATLVRQMLAYEYQESVWRIVEDPRLERGGCRIETPEGDLDASLEARWRRIVAALGVDSPWRRTDGDDGD